MWSFVALVLLGRQASAQDLIVDGSNSPYTIASAASFRQVTVTSAGTLVVNAPLTATQDMLVSGRVATAATDYTLRLVVQGRLTVDATGSIDVTGRGLLGSPASGDGYAGQTMDPTTFALNLVPASQEAGGVHATRGGRCPSAPYGNAAEPVTPGGGGSRYNQTAGNGGGVIKVTAGTLVLDGQLLANGAAGLTMGGGGGEGGGAGGSINLTLGVFSGAGAIRANGANGWTAAGPSVHGGAGRIKVASTAYAFTGRVEALDGIGTPVGTVVLSDTTADQVIIEGPRTFTGGEHATSLQLRPGSTLTLAGSATVSTPVNVPVGATLILNHPTALDHLTVATVAGTLIVNQPVAQRAPMHLGGRLVLNSRLELTDFDTEAGAVVTHDAAVNAMHLKASGRVTLVSGSSMNGAGMGYARGAGAFGFGWAIDPTNGMLLALSPPGTGGSHAGVGGTSLPPTVAALAYDSPAAPMFCGGGGAGGVNGAGTGAFIGGAGGGLIRVTAASMVLDGLLTVDGAPSDLNQITPGGVTRAGGGAGGSIILTVDDLSGGGALSAQGGLGPYMVGGGGGIINVSTIRSTFTGTMAVRGGAGSWPASDGVVVQVQLPWLPHITSSAPTLLRTGATLTYAAQATGRSPITWSLPVGPAGAALSDAGVLSWASGDAGIEAFEVHADNSHGGDVQRFSVQILDPPVITSAPRKTAVLGIDWSYDDDGHVEATGGSPLTWSTSLAPAGFSVDGTGAVHWVPQSLGATLACVEATNPVGRAQQCFAVSVVALEGTDGGMDGGLVAMDAGVDAGVGPHFLSQPSTSAACGSPYHYSGTHTPQVAGVGPFTFSLKPLSGADLPEGLTVDSATGELTWTPSRTQRGTYPMVLVVEDSRGLEEQAFAVVVDCADPTKAQLSCAAAPAVWPWVALLWLARCRRSKASTPTRTLREL